MRQRSFFLKLILQLVATGVTVSVLASAPDTGQRAFATPQEAGRALLDAAEADDLAALTNIFGPGAEEILNSGDTVADKNDRDQFVKRAKQSMKERISPVHPGKAVLLIGAGGFPFPVPLVRTAGRWRFDTPAGKTEILDRRIGSNELDAIAACKAYVDAQYDYATEDRNKSGIPEYAHKLISSPGKRDGLFWPGTEAPSTEFTAKVKAAQAKGYQKQGELPSPYHGYYFRILTGQGPAARGGALDYIQHGLMIGGFGLIAWPVNYRVSGVKTFIVNQEGFVFEKDLGASTDSAAEAITAFNPDSTWRRVR